MKGIKNVPASVRQRLLDRSRQEKRPFQELLQYYAMERFLYRLSQSPHSERFILKGALMLRVWQTPQNRPTMDIDMLGKTNNDIGAIMDQIREILAVNVVEDGLVFDPESLKAETITEDANYQGVRVTFTGALANARIKMQLDIGFGDLVYPAPERERFPTLLDFPTPEVLCYSRESAIAEKYQAMVHLGDLNSRMKDFYDIWLLARQFDFELQPLKEAIARTFSQRKTELPESHPFSTAFISSKQQQWWAFNKRLGQDHVPDQFQDIVDTVVRFLSPVMARDKQPSLSQIWKAPGPWSTQVDD